MPSANVIERIREKYLAVITDLNERGRRHWAAAEARSLGWGGISAVAQATGLSDRTIRTGIRELDAPDTLPSTRQPAISVDTKKKEPFGNMKNPGKTYRPTGNPTKVKTHDFPDRELGKAVP